MEGNQNCTSERNEEILNFAKTGVFARNKKQLKSHKVNNTSGTFTEVKMARLCRILKSI